MPYPSQVNRDNIIQQAWQMIEEEGVQQLSLNKLAASLNIKAPSLYRHVSSKADLLQAVNLLTLQKLFDGIANAIPADNPPLEQMTAVLRTYRQFALSHPHTYELVYQHNPAARPDENILVQLILPIQEIMAGVTGPEKSLAALRGALALAHGFVMLEIKQQLQRGGDLDADFQQVVKAYLNGWQSP